MKNTFAAIFLLISILTLGQNNLFTNIKQGALSNIKAIIENENVKGYYAIYPIEKTSKKTYEFGLILMDNNLKTTHETTILATKSTVLIDAAYNGEYFCFTFYDEKNSSHSIEHKIFNKSAELVSSIPSQALQFKYDDENMNSLLGTIKIIHSVPGVGFAWIKKDKSGKPYIEVFDETGNNKWSSQAHTNPDKYIVENIKILQIDSAVVLISSEQYRQPFGNIKNTSVSVLNSKTGVQILKHEFKHKDLIQNIIGGERKSENEYIFHGEYYGKDNSGELNGNDKKGIYNAVINNNGIVSEKYNSWDEFGKHISLNKNGKMEKNNYIFFHNIQHDAEGNYYFIGEQYKISLSAKLNSVMGPMNPLSNGSSEYKVKTDNIVITKTNNAFTIDTVIVFEKDQNTLNLPNPMTKGFRTDDQGITEMMSYYQWFDYCFTTKSSSGFNSIFIDFDKFNWKSAGSNYTIYNILNLDNEVKNVKIDLKNNPDFFSVLPAKPGYIAIYEYFKKSKKVDFRLEKLDY